MRLPFLCAYISRAYRQRLGTLLLMLALVIGSGIRVSVSVDSVAEFPYLAPNELAHFLADFSNHQRLYPLLGSWSIEKETNNYTSWRYTVRYECGPRCYGWAEIMHEEATSGAAPRHGHADVRSHRIHIAHTYCTRLPLLPWPIFCGETETEAMVKKGREKGSIYTERSRTSCAIVRILSGRCQNDLKVERDGFLQRLQMFLLNDQE